MDCQALYTAGALHPSSVLVELTTAATAATAAATDGASNTLLDRLPAPAPLSAAAAAAATKPQARPHHPKQLQPHRAPSKRQAHKGTFTRILQHQHEEDVAYAEFEAAVRQGSKRGSKRPAAAQAQPPQPSTAPNQLAVHEDEVVVIKRKRGRPPKPRPLTPIPTRPLLYGSHLQSVLQEVRAVRARALPVGTAVWVKVRP
ncbi:hypothetical protein COO60DRAFT_3827 [Scenedesmus sp. NREL 46B-D3]|nr:hypothetical protein COO60DRAFT_3827 [Scenedesmus sp. NREL 46B-D3]